MAHQKRQRPLSQAGRRGEGRIEVFGGCPSAPAPGAYTASKYAGNRKTEGL